MIISTVKNTVNNNYPYLGINKYGLVVLFTSPKSGILMYSTHANIIKYQKAFLKLVLLGEYSINWDEGTFKVYGGVVSIHN